MFPCLQDNDTSAVAQSCFGLIIDEMWINLASNRAGINRLVVPGAEIPVGKRLAQVGLGVQPEFMADIAHM
jgi:hypothetical protein